MDCRILDGIARAIPNRTCYTPIPRNTESTGGRICIGL
ncbi:hypothetical protein DICVIV_14359 [Dictyocaulus viviparus]|uniref:Uncharacterized protein n=1 Tax=Dictyocaulus viviparus TaxID=29172 RepID=A0A0D8X5K3_DICVI|nr:hypothetical protein DICVIV_14359 [Dictyocaulus viviparus]